MTNVTREKVSNDGQFKRTASAFRNWITPDGTAGPSGEAGFKAESGRYHLYVSLACPWAHRTLIMRALKGLEHHVSVSVVHWLMLEEGWVFSPGIATIADTVNHVASMRELYRLASPDYRGRITVPVLWDKQRNTIVNNESSEIIRMLNSAFDHLGAVSGNYYPDDLRHDIDHLNHRIYDTINNGVYKSGFASTQSAYEQAVIPLFDTLDWLEKLLSTQRYLTGDMLTEADIRLFTTLVRFDVVYVGHFKCNIRRLADYPNLSGYTRDIYQLPKIAATVNIHHIKSHYYQSHRSLNPSGIVPVGPEIDFSLPHSRAVLSSLAVSNSQ
jgi:glutathionyl-hydroquinone reductase